MGLFWAMSSPVGGHELQPVNVSGEAQQQPLPVAASEGRVDGDELRTRPILRTGEVMETVPGLIYHPWSLPPFSRDLPDWDWRFCAVFRRA